MNFEKIMGTDNFMKPYFRKVSTCWFSMRKPPAFESNSNDGVLLLFFTGSLWVSVVLNPRCDREDRCKWSAALETWAKLEICPLEDPDHRHSSSRHREENSHKRPRLGPYAIASSSSHKRAKRSHKPRTIFHQALDALHMDWTDPILVKILQ